MSEKPSYEELEQRIAELEKSQLFFENLLDMLPEYVSYIDKNHTYKFANSTYQQFFNVDPDSMIGLHPKEVLGNEAFQEVEANHKAALAGQEQEYESTFLLPNGEIFYFHAHYLPHIENGQVKGFLALVRDITERKQAEQERLANIHFLDSTDRINRAIQGTNDLDQMMSDVLDEVISIFNCDRAFLINFSGPDLESWTMPIARWRNEYPISYLNEPLPLDSLGQKVIRAIIDSKEPVQAGPGTAFPLTKHVSESFGFKSFMGAALYPKSGDLWELGIHQCSHERIFTTEEERLFKEITIRLTDALTSFLLYRSLRESEERYRLIAEATSDYIYSARIFSDYSSSLDWVGGAFTDVTGYDPDEIKSLPEGWLSVIHPEDTKKIFEEEAFPLKSRTSGWGYEYRIITKRGDIRWVYDRIIKIETLENEDVQVYGGIQNISERKIAEEKLRFQAKLLEAVEQAVIATDTEGKIIYTNPFIEKLYGWKSEEAIGRNIIEITVPDISKDQATEIMNTLNRAESWSGEFLVQHKDGSVFPAHVTDTPIYDENGTLKGVIGISMDISDRKQSEESLRQSEEKYRLIAKNATDVIWVLDPESQVIKYVSPSIYHMLGFTEKEFINRSVAQAVTPASFEYIQRTTPIRIERMLQGDTRYYTDEIDVIHKDGHIVPTEINMHFVKNQSTGLIEGMGVMRDVTERKQAEEALRTSEQFLAEMGSIAKIGGWEHDLVTREAYWTHETYKIVEIESGPIPGPDEHLSYYQPKDREKFKKAFNLSVETGEQFDLELHATTAKGRSIWVRVVGQPEYSDGNCVKMKGIIQDITDQKKMEDQLQQAQKLESIGTLAGGIAHDFNNILSSIIGFTELALDDVTKGTPQEDNLQEVYTAGKRARDLVKQILAFARQSDEERKPIRVDTIAKEALKLIRSTIPTTIEIRENIENSSLIMGNPSQVHQLFMNLCTNAAQAMEDVGGMLEVGLTDVEHNDQSPLTQSELKSGSYMKVTISDTGPGIAPNIIGSIFEPYFTTKGVGEGTGMGLALAHGIVESYGGKITVASELGKGTLFSVYLPTTKKSEAYRPCEDEKLPSGTERILFVDDELPIAKMGSQVFERLGYLVTVRTSSVEALELFRSKPNEFDLVISDMTMPNMTGDELAMELIALRADIPVILCTGYSKKITDEKAAKIGIKAIAYKPVVTADLAKTVRKVLDEAKQ